MPSGKDRILLAIGGTDQQQLLLGGAVHAVGELNSEWQQAHWRLVERKWTDSCRQSQQAEQADCSGSS